MQVGLFSWLAARHFQHLFFFFLSGGGGGGGGTLFVIRGYNRSVSYI